MWEFDGQIVLPGRAQRGRRPPARGLAASSRPASTRCAPGCYDIDARVRRHGHQRRVGVGELPVADHRLLRLGVLALLRSRARARGRRRRGTTGSSTSGTRRTPSASSRWASRSSATPSWARRRSGATRRAGSPRSRCPEQPHRIGMPTDLLRLVGSDHRRVRRDRHRDLPARRVDRRRRHPAGRADGAARRDAVRPARRSRRARSGCGRATRCGIPTLKIAMSEGGIGWVAMLHDRLENIVDRSGYGRYFAGDLRPADVLHRNFWFCTIDDPSTLSTRHDRRRRPHHVRDRLPARRRHLARHPGGLRRRSSARSPTDEVAKISHENAAALFRHPLPPPDTPHAVGLRR